MDSKVKSDKISDKIRQTGNKSFEKEDYFVALDNYNRALRYAESNYQFGLAYGNRSAAFLQVKQYKACLQNIELARKYKLPEATSLRLNEREIECKNLMETDQTPIEETWNEFFKLSYEPNSNFPYLSDCLELKKRKEGMFLTTNRDLKAGDIIAISEPFVMFNYDTSSYRCNYCLADKFMNFIPCTGCTEVMFCDENCMQMALNEFHQFECGVHDNPKIDDFYMNVLRMIVKCNALFDFNRIELQTFMKSNTKLVAKKLVTPFDFDLTDPSSLASKKNIMLTQVCYNQQYGIGYDFPLSAIQPFLTRHPKLRNITTLDIFNLAARYAMGDAKRFKSIGGKALSKNNLHPGQFTINYYADAIDTCSNILRYSCAPNMVLHPYNGKMIWIVHCPIKANDWLTVALNNTTFFEKSRKERLDSDVAQIVARCKCPACVGNWDRVFAALVIPIYIMRYSSEEAIEKYSEYCKDINENWKSLAKCDDNVWFAVNNFRWNVIQIGKASFWDKIPPMEFGNMRFF